MKTLGTTIEGNYIVEMSLDEHYTFLELEASINNLPIVYIDRRTILNGTILAPVFQSLRDLVEAKVSINKLKEYVNLLDKIFGSSK